MDENLKQAFDKTCSELGLLCEEKPLPPKYRDHALMGNYGG